jgi:RHS repeat-associated protein
MEKVDYGGGELTKLYVYGPTGLLAVNDNGGWFFLLKDHLGSTRVVLNENNNVVSSYDYMPYGGIMRSRVNTDIAYQFTGQEYDTELGLHNFRARLYDSDLAMFYAMDPAGQTYSPFAYSGNNPVIYVDPDGEFFIIDDFFYGFIRGIVEGKNPFKEGWESASNSYEIWSTMFRGNFGQILGKWTWELPNQLIGIFVGHVPNITGDINSVTHRDGATLIEHKAKNWGAFTVGSVITAEKDTDVNSGLFMHEYGHYIQSQRWGLLYVPVIGLPILMSASGLLGGEHHNFYTERWANENALDHFGDKYREYYDRIYDDDPWNDYYKNLRKINKKETYSVVNRDNLQLSKKKINKLYIKFKSKKYNKTNSKRRLYDF